MGRPAQEARAFGGNHEPYLADVPTIGICLRVAGGRLVAVGHHPRVGDAERHEVVLVALVVAPGGRGRAVRRAELVVIPPVGGLFPGRDLVVGAVVESLEAADERGVVAVAVPRRRVDLEPAGRVADADVEVVAEVPAVAQDVGVGQVHVIGEARVVEGDDEAVRLDVAEPLVGGLVGVVVPRGGRVVVVRAGVAGVDGAVVVRTVADVDGVARGQQAEEEEGEQGEGAQGHVDLQEAAVLSLPPLGWVPLGRDVFEAERRTERLLGRLLHKSLRFDSTTTYHLQPNSLLIRFHEFQLKERT